MACRATSRPCVVRIARRHHPGDELRRLYGRRVGKGGSVSADCCANRCRDANTYSHTISYADADCDANYDANADCDADCDANADRDTFTYGSARYTDPYPYTYANANTPVDDRGHAPADVSRQRDHDREKAGRRRKL